MSHHSHHSHHHDLSRSTHTPELVQLRELNEHLAAANRSRSAVTAADLGLTGDGASSQSPGLPVDAVLDHLSAEGPPDFPNIAGRFRTSATSGPDSPLLEVEMHTATLRRLSETFRLRHIWGA